jgi:hypothetical protein
VKLGDLSDFVLPIIILVLYFVLSARKKKEEPKEREEQEEPQAPRSPAASRPPPAKRGQQILRSSIEDRKIESAIEKRHYSSAVTQERGGGLVSEAMLKYSDADVPHAPKKRKGVSRASKLLQRNSLRKAFLVKEVLNRPYE